VHHFKWFPKPITHYGTNMKSEADPVPFNRFPTSHLTMESRSPLLLGRCSHHLCKSCTGANMVYSRADRVFIIEHYFASKSSAAVPEAFSNAYSVNEVQNKTKKFHRLIKFRDTESFCLWQVLIERKRRGEITAVPISSSASAATMGYGCKNSILPLVSSFCARRGSCVVVSVAF
jgi:hypothetical protein